MILLFAKYPFPGQVKTRLIPELGVTRAARLHRRLTEATFDTAQASGLPVLVCFTGSPLRRFRNWLGKGVSYVPQRNGDLGQRMEHAFASAFRQGTTKAIAIGADLPGLTPELLRDASKALAFKDVVLGPATDGGYYLIGMRQPYPVLFRDISWGTDQVFAQTIKALHEAGLTYCELPTLSDIDRPDDLNRITNDPRCSDALDQSPRLSVIIPTFNEEAVIASTIASVRNAYNVEIIVADGGSTDRTRSVAQAEGAIVLEFSGGRAVQLNGGAARASSKRLLFLHADTKLPLNYEEAIHSVLDDSSVALGAFGFKTNWSSSLMRIVEWGTNLRSRRLRWPYGDQGLFVERRFFDRVGAFPLRQVMEDFELVRRLRRHGSVVTLSGAATTSARRWEKHGVLRVWAINQVMVLGYWAGVSDKRLARFYRCRGNSSK